MANRQVESVRLVKRTLSKHLQKNRNSRKRIPAIYGWNSNIESVVKLGIYPLYEQISSDAILESPLIKRFEVNFLLIKLFYELREGTVTRMYRRIVEEQLAKFAGLQQTSYCKRL